MTTAFDRAAAALAADANIGADAIYTPQGEAPLPLRLVLARDEGPTLGIGQGIVAAGHYCMIQTADVPDRPLKGEALSIDGQDFLVETSELDASGATWRVTLRRA